MRSRAVFAALALTVALAGCATAGGGPTAEPTPEPTTPAEPTPAAVIVSLEALTVVDESGEALEATRFDDPEPVLALLGELLGSTPEPDEYPEVGITSYDWGDAVFVVSGPDYSSVRVNVAVLGGLPVQTPAGIGVGSSRDDVLAEEVYDPEFDVDGDGFSDFYGLEPVTNPDYPSLNLPGQPGTDFIEVQLEGDRVSSLRSPSNDYTDV
jgi:hypothetical protein